MTEEQLAAVRRYKPAEAVQSLNIPAKWLKNWVREGRVPHRRPGKRRVWFTAEDILEIGRMLPELMSQGRTSPAMTEEQLADHRVCKPEVAASGLRS
jgi:hypothetical protein